MSKCILIFCSFIIVAYKNAPGIPFRHFKINPYLIKLIQEKKETVNVKTEERETTTKKKDKKKSAFHRKKEKNKITKYEEKNKVTESSTLLAIKKK